MDRLSNRQLAIANKATTKAHRGSIPALRRDTKAVAGKKIPGEKSLCRFESGRFTKAIKGRLADTRCPKLLP